MSSIFYLEIAQPTRSIRHYTARSIATCWELLIAKFCSLICFLYISRVEDQANNGVSSTIRLPSVDEGHFQWILDPPPVLMLGACLALGCTVSSFAYRRHESDKYQTPVFVLALTTASLIGLGRGYSANFIMLGLIPWAVCGAMVLSVIIHSIGRRCCRRSDAEINCCERGEKEYPTTKT